MAAEMTQTHTHTHTALHGHPKATPPTSPRDSHLVALELQNFQLDLLLPASFAVFGNCIAQGLGSVVSKIIVGQVQAEDVEIWTAGGKHTNIRNEDATEISIGILT